MTRQQVSTKTIGELCEFESGNGFRPQDWKQSGLPIIRIQNLNGSNIFNYFDGKADPSWIVEPGDLLFAWAGVKGVSFGPTIWGGPRGVLNQHIYRIRPKPGVNKRWLYYALSEVTAEIESKAHGFKTSLVHVRKADITGACIAAPAADEQQAVAATLMLWDAALEKGERLAAAKERARVAMTNMLLFGRDRAADWPVVDIGSIAREAVSTNSSADDLPVLSCTKHDGLVESLKYFDKQVFSQDTSKYKIVRRGQFAYATNHLEEGSIGLQEIVPAGLVSPMYTVFEIREDRVDAGYLYKLLKTERLRKVFAAKTNASVDRRGSLRWSAFSRIRLSLPSLDEQRRINAVLDHAKRECNLLRAIAEALRRQRRGLMERLLTDKWHSPIEDGVSA